MNNRIFIEAGPFKAAGFSSAVNRQFVEIAVLAEELICL